MRIVNYPAPSPAPSVAIPTTPATVLQDLEHHQVREADIRTDDGHLVATVRDGVYSAL